VSGISVAYSVQPPVLSLNKSKLGLFFLHKKTNFRPMSLGTKDRGKERHGRGALARLGALSPFQKRPAGFFEPANLSEPDQERATGHQAIYAATERLAFRWRGRRC
jgi:hypothetical protein